MKLNRQIGGVIRRREYAAMGEIYKERSEHFIPMGPFKINGKDFVAVAYFNNWVYRKWIIRNGISILASFLSPSFYLKSKSLASQTKGMKLMDSKANFVSDNDLKTRIARIALVWIDVYLVPAFPPRTFDVVSAKMKLQKKILQQCKQRKFPKAKEPAEKLYLDQLRKADLQVIEYYPIFKRHHALLKRAKNFFIDISDKPSETKALKLKPVMRKLALNFGELSEWCNQRSQSWPEFVDTTELYKEYKNKQKSYLERYGPSTLWTVVMGIIGHLISKGNLAFSTAFSIAAKFGIGGLKQILSFKWQAGALKKQARVYLQFSERINDFLKIYDVPLRDGFLR